MATSNSFEISVLVFKQDDLWFVHCLEYDIVAQGSSKESAKELFNRMFLCQLMIDVENNRTPFSGWEKAPKEIWGYFNKWKDQLVQTREPLYIPDSYINAAVNKYDLVTA